MNNKSRITYWILEIGQDAGEAIDILSTEVVKVPVVGEIINFNTKIDKDRLKMKFRHLTEKQLNAFLPIEEKQIRGQFVVTKVSRWLETSQVSVKSSSFEIVSTEEGSTSNFDPEIPVECVHEVFEVFMQKNLY